VDNAIDFLESNCKQGFAFIIWCKQLVQHVIQKASNFLKNNASRDLACDGNN
jgi:hypothetical protein